MTAGNDDIKRKIEAFVREWESETPFIEAHTSGSTGKPKTIRLSKQFVRASAQRSCQFFGIDSSSRLHLCLSPDYIAGKMLIIRALISGATLSFEPPSSAPLATTECGEISLISVVGSQLAGLKNNVASNPCLKIKKLLVGGAPLNAEMIRLAEKGPWEAWESYGMTETASHVALRRIHAKNPEPFHALEGIHFSLEEDDRLTIHIPGEKPLITNDLATLIDSRSFILHGRRDNVIISGGLKISPEDLEQRLASFLPGKNFYISSIPSSKWGFVPLLVIEGERFLLPSFKSSNIEKWQLPHSVRFCPEGFKRTSSGKIIREHFEIADVEQIFEN